MGKGIYPEVEPLSRSIVERIAYVVGESSAAAKALIELDRRLALGENVCVYQAGRSFFVGPAPRERTTLHAPARKNQPIFKP